MRDGFSFFFTLIFILLSCSEDPLIDEITLSSNSLVSFKTSIQGLLEKRCFPCHNETYQVKNIVLETYEQVLIPAKNGSLLGSIRWEAPFKAMPRNIQDQSIAEKMPANEIRLIEQWIAEGMKNN